MNGKGYAKYVVSWNVLDTTHHGGLALTLRAWRLGASPHGTRHLANTRVDKGHDLDH